MGCVFTVCFAPPVTSVFQDRTPTANWNTPYSLQNIPLLSQLQGTRY